VLDHLPEELRASTARVLQDAWHSQSAKTGKRRLENLARSLEKEHPGAAASIREGLDETLTLLRLGISPEGALFRSLCSTNPIENLNGSVARYTRNVKRWRGGSMVLRWVGAAIQRATLRFRRVRGYRELDTLSSALRAHDLEPQAEAISA